MSMRTMPTGYRGPRTPDPADRLSDASWDSSSFSDAANGVRDYSNSPDGSPIGRVRVRSRASHRHEREGSDPFEFDLHLDLELDDRRASHAIYSRSGGEQDLLDLTDASVQFEVADPSAPNTTPPLNINKKYEHDRNFVADYCTIGRGRGGAASSPLAAYSHRNQPSAGGGFDTYGMSLNNQHHAHTAPRRRATHDEYPSRPTNPAAIGKHASAPGTRLPMSAEVFADLPARSTEDVSPLLAETLTRASTAQMLAEIARREAAADAQASLSRMSDHQIEQEIRRRERLKSFSSQRSYNLQDEYSHHLHPHAEVDEAEARAREITMNLLNGRHAQAQAQLQAQSPGRFVENAGRAPREPSRDFSVISLPGDDVSEFGLVSYCPLNDALGDGNPSDEPVSGWDESFDSKKSAGLKHAKGTLRRMGKSITNRGQKKEEQGDTSIGSEEHGKARGLRGISRKLSDRLSRRKTDLTSPTVGSPTPYDHRETIYPLDPLYISTSGDLSPTMRHLPEQWVYNDKEVGPMIMTATVNEDLINGRVEAHQERLEKKTGLMRRASEKVRHRLGSMGRRSRKDSRPGLEDMMDPADTDPFAFPWGAGISRENRHHCFDMCESQHKVAVHKLEPPCMCNCASCNPDADRRGRPLANSYM